MCEVVRLYGLQGFELKLGDLGQGFRRRLRKDFTVGLPRRPDATTQARNGILSGKPCALQIPSMLSWEAKVCMRVLCLEFHNEP